MSYSLNMASENQPNEPGLRLAPLAPLAEGFFVHLQVCQFCLPLHSSLPLRSSSTGSQVRAALSHL